MPLNDTSFSKANDSLLFTPTHKSRNVMETKYCTTVGSFSACCIKWLNQSIPFFETNVNGILYLYYACMRTLFLRKRANTRRTSSVALLMQNIKRSFRFLTKHKATEEALTAALGSSSNFRCDADVDASANSRATSAPRSGNYEVACCTLSVSLLTVPV